MKTDTIVIGASFGGVQAIKTILENLKQPLPVSILIVLHIGNNNNLGYISSLKRQLEIQVKEAEEKEVIKPGVVYFAPPNYHLLVEEDGSLSLSTSPKENYSRPAIDMLFETAAWAYRENLLGILLTGASSDGALGMKMIKKYGGITIVENPATACASIMPGEALKCSTPDYIMDLHEIPQLLEKLLNT